MRKFLIIACLLPSVAIANAAHPTTDHKRSSGQKFSKFLKHKIVPKHKTRKRSRRKKPMDVQVKVYAAQQYTVDLLVTCKKRNILLTYNKIDKKFCTKKYKCHTSLRRAIRPYCKR